MEIIIAGGDYYLEQPLVFTTEDSGTEGAPLIIKGKEGDTPIFSGGVQLNKFERVSDKLWKTYIPEIARYGGSVQQLFVNGERAVRARTPNLGSFFKTKGVSEISLDPGKGYHTRLAVQKISLTTAQVAALKLAYPDIQNTIVSINHAWDMTRKYIQGISVQDSILFITGRPMTPYSKLDNCSQFFFENSKGFLDAPGEWFLEQDGTLFYVPREGETIEKTVAIVPVIEQFIIIKGDGKQQVENIRFENLSFRYSRYFIPTGGDEPEQAAANTDASVMINYARNILFRDCEISHTGTNAIWFKSIMYG